MSQYGVYPLVRAELVRHLSDALPSSTLERLTLLVVGMLKAKSAAPSAVARALETLGLSSASQESIERRIRRIENDPDLTAGLCLHPLARAHLCLGRPKRLLIVVDPTTREDQVVVVSVSVWYRGRALPVAFAVWAANTPLVGERFWERIEALLEAVASVVPNGVEVVVLADRAFGTPAFTDLLTALCWHYVVRVQGQTRVQDRIGRLQTVRSLVRGKGERRKMGGKAFKARGFRPVSIVVFYAKRFGGPLCLASSLPPSYALIDLYRQRYAIEAHFRDLKSHGFQWEQGQVRDLAHITRLFIGMALSAWIVMLLGERIAEEILENVRKRHRRTRPFEAKQSLFSLGLHQLHMIFGSATYEEKPLETLTHWDTPSWQRQLMRQTIRHYILACPTNSKLPVRP